MTNGVPHGGVLSPTLFLIYINDMKEELSRKVYPALYADDLALISSGEEKKTAKLRLQTTPDGITRWTDEWGLKIKANITAHTILSLSIKDQRAKLQVKNHTLEKNNSP
ncbi:RNA-directed DNA polymerase from mobile element jockey [Plakobranchus ocellatus]|uniref:RNA-directed DNA polymerase from mobile element jockey n=1 Tax=Plakobranchus ocellatus TaxID=259542 RepID=A0AAV4AZU2_9GAST|nr:RNA-directed DNA polymerase from mobile element jockey [Plakobranchus ocellatus]